MLLDKTLESPLDSKENKPVNPKGNQSFHWLEGLMLRLRLQYFGHKISLNQLLNCVWLSVTPWTAECQASLSITNSWSLLKLMSIESMIPYHHLIFCCPLLLLPGASVRNPIHDKVMQQRPWWARRIRPQVFPLVFPEHVPPKNKNLPALFYFSTFLTLSGKS